MTSQQPLVTRSGATLVEILVVLVLLGLALTLAGLTLRRGSDSATAPEAANKIRAQIAAVRVKALRSSQPATTVLEGPITLALLALPDGSIVVEPGLDSLVGLDALSGRTLDAGSEKRTSNAP
jgi:prepilin-type N-terminal cleavage/methylation domain-containing protein